MKKEVLKNNDQRIPIENVWGKPYKNDQGVY